MSVVLLLACTWLAQSLKEFRLETLKCFSWAGINKLIWWENRSLTIQLQTCFCRLQSDRPNENRAQRSELKVQTSTALVWGQTVDVCGSAWTQPNYLPTHRLDWLCTRDCHHIIKFTRAKKQNECRVTDELLALLAPISAGIRGIVFLNEAVCVLLSFCLSEPHFFSPQP